MDRPKEAISRFHQFYDEGRIYDDCFKDCLQYLDWLEGKHVVEWPKELTRERLEALVNLKVEVGMVVHPQAKERTRALRALAAIAPVRKKRVVNLWESKHSKPIAFPVGEAPEVGTWRCVARNIELEE